MHYSYMSYQTTAAKKVANIDHVHLVVYQLLLWSKGHLLLCNASGQVGYVPPIDVAIIGIGDVFKGY